MSETLWPDKKRTINKQICEVRNQIASDLEFSSKFKLYGSNKNPQIRQEKNIRFIAKASTLKKN